MSSHDDLSTLDEARALDAVLEHIRARGGAGPDFAEAIGDIPSRDEVLKPSMRKAAIRKTRRFAGTQRRARSTRSTTERS